MIPILIVDDEAAIRESLAEMLRRRYPGRFDIELTENGRQAVERAQSHRAELILADIKMPILSGLDMLDELKNCRLESRVIFISGFDDYAFVRRAMKQGAVDYLLKPVAEEELFAQIDSFLKQRVLDPAAERETWDDPDALKHPYVQQSLLERIVQDPDQACEALGRYAAIDSESRVLILAFSSQENEAPQPWREALRAAALGRKDTLLIGGAWNRAYLCVVLCEDGKSARSFMDRLNAAGLPAEDMVCSSPAHPSEMGEALRECQALQNRRFYDMPGKEGPESYPYSQLIAQLAEAVSQYRADAFDALFERLMRYACAQCPPSELLRSVLLAMIYTAMQQNTALVPVVSELELTQDDILRCIQNAGSASSLASEVPRIVRLVIDKAQVRAVAPEVFHVERACAYIENHFAQNLTLTELAERLALHPNYLSTLFTRVRGMPFSQYLRHVRIQEACRLIRQTNEKLYNIGAQVGYPDPVHFTRTFREDMGCTPREYRRTHSEVKTTR